MNWKTCLLFVLLSGGIYSCNSGAPAKKVVKETQALGLPIPKGWTTEEIPFPIEFAPEIAYTGKESLRFPPGWEFTASSEHWSYAFLWSLTGKPDINAKTLQDDLTIYHTGLVGRNITKRNIPQNKVTKVVAKIEKAPTTPVGEGAKRCMQAGKPH